MCVLLDTWNQKKKTPPFAELGGMNEAKLIGFGNRMMMMMMNDK